MYLTLFNAKVTELRCIKLITINTQYYNHILILYENFLKAITNEIERVGRRMSLIILSSFKTIKITTEVHTL